MSIGSDGNETWSFVMPSDGDLWAIQYEMTSGQVVVLADGFTVRRGTVVVLPICRRVA